MAAFFFKSRSIQINLDLYDEIDQSGEKERADLSGGSAAAAEMGVAKSDFS